MLVVVLTGGIGSGKSAAAEFFRGRGASVIDLDDVAGSVMQSGSPVLSLVSAEFGEGVLRADGSLDREVLAQSCFASPESARRLDEIVHPAVAQEVRSALDQIRGLAEPPDVVVVEVPLLAEAPDFAEIGDVVVAISAPEALRVDRAVSRGMERSDVLRRADVQAPDSARAALADVVVTNDGTHEAFVRALEGLWGQFVDAGTRNG